MPSKAAPPKARDNSRRKSNRVTAAKDEVEDIDNISDIDSDDSPPSTAVDIPLRVSLPLNSTYLYALVD